MGTYVNPGNGAFKEIADETYIDKTGMIAVINQSVGTKNKLSCVSRPRRFGKSWAAKMLAAYYDCSCDSNDLFRDKIIASNREYEAFLNQFNVIYLDISGFISEIRSSGQTSLSGIPEMIKTAIWKDLNESGFIPGEDDTLNDYLLRCVRESEGRQFIFIIDEWDAVIREAKNDKSAQTAYLNLLRGWFKNSNFTPKAVGAAYMTGILPIKKDGTQSAISDFIEYTVLEPGGFAEYTGFTEKEVKEICKKNDLSFEEIKAWYDGYELAGIASVYNPFSVMCAVRDKKCRSYWTPTSAAEGLTDYIKMDFSGLQETVANLIAGSEAEVNTVGFQNDLERFKTKDDVFTLLIHLGYLTYDTEQRTVHIPNKEVREEFINFLTQDVVDSSWIRLIERSKKIMSDTLARNEEAVAAALEEIRGEQYAPQYYNNEQSLRAIIKYAYLAVIGNYVKVEEMPSGKGIADVVFVPTPFSRLPAMVVELKWNKTSGGAIAQIRNKKYTAVLKPFAGNILLVGINYDDSTGKHSCLIETA